MSLVQRITAAVSQIALDIKNLTNKQGDLTSLSTTQKANLVSAINEIYTALGNAGAKINDTAGNGDTTVTWSADKIYDTIELAKSAVKGEILGGASAAYDTLLEIQNMMQADDTTAAAMATAINNRLAFDAPQTLTTAQKLQGSTNLGIGDPETDFLAVYNTAKA